MLSQELAVVDNLSGKIYLIVYADPSQPDGYERARERLEDIRTQLRQSCAIPLLAANTPKPSANSAKSRSKPALTKSKTKNLAGDCMQVVPSQRMSIEFTDSSLALYRALRTLNPFCLISSTTISAISTSSALARNPRPPRTRRCHRPPHRRRRACAAKPRRRPCQRTRFVKRCQRNRRTRHVD